MGRPTFITDDEVVNLQEFKPHPNQSKNSFCLFLLNQVINKHFKYKNMDISVKSDDLLCIEHLLWFSFFYSLLACQAMAWTGTRQQSSQTLQIQLLRKAHKDI